MFHHSNVELPIAWERRLSRFVVTPRMHSTHHSIVRKETDSNWSSGLTVWDWLHGTLRLDVPQDAITIGVPAYRQPEEVSLAENHYAAVCRTASELALTRKLWWRATDKAKQCQCGERSTISQLSGIA